MSNANKAKYGDFVKVIVNDPISVNLRNVTYSGNGWSKSGDNFTYEASGGLKVGNTSTTLTITGIVSNVPANKDLSNTATITNIYNHHSRDVKSYTGGTFSATVAAKIKGYKVRIDKYVDGINGVLQNGRSTLDEARKKDNPLALELGDKVSFRIIIKNEGIGDAYGDINNITLTDTIKKNGSNNLCMVLEAIQEQNATNPNLGNGQGTWTSARDATVGTWTVVSDASSGGTKFTINYSGKVEKGKSVSLYIAFKITNRSLYNDILENIVDLTSIQNKNGISIPITNTVLLEGKFTSSDYLRYLKYTTEFQKNIISITDNNGNQTTYNRAGSNNTVKYNNPVEVEKGYTIVYQVDIKNIDETNLKEFILNDTFEGISFAVNDVVARIDNTVLSPTVTINGNNCRMTFTIFSARKNAKNNNNSASNNK